MAWNPELYDSFKDVRYKPFYDLSARIKAEPHMQAIDLGCGTGEQTSLLTEKFPDSTFLGVDSSAEMLEKSQRFANDRLHFELASIEHIAESDKKYDLLFSNAALQWTDHHETLFPKLINLLQDQGQIAIQMPVQNENILNQLLFSLASEEPFAGYLNYFNRESTVLSMDEYAQILFDHGISDLQISQNVYPIIADTHEALYQFISGTALIPYLDRLEADNKQVFIEAFKARIAERFTKLPAIYAFKRILIYGRKSSK